MRDFIHVTMFMSPSCLQSGQGKLVVMGSAHVFSDQYLDKEENSKLQEVIFRWLTSDEVSLNSIDADDPEVSIVNSLMKATNIIHIPI